MSKKITGSEYPLSKIFSSEFRYFIPPYQRPYGWTKEETGILFDDLYDFYCDEKNKEDNYFLGCIVLIKESEDKHDVQVVDGQQRLTTLTILLSVIISRLTGENRNDLENYIREPGSITKGLKSSPRLQLRDKDRDFFEKFIQEGNFEEFLKIEKETLPNEAQQHILENYKLLLQKINKEFQVENTLMDFAVFLMQRCFLVTVTTMNQLSAYRIFSVMNNRGLDLMAIDIIKADILGLIPSNEQNKYTEKWENLEEQIGRNGFNDVFVYTRMIYAVSKAKKTLIEEFREYVLNKEAPKELIDNVLTSYTNAYFDIKNENYVSTENAAEINDLLKWLNKIDNSDWIPVAILFLSNNRSDSEFCKNFFVRLERLAAFMHATSKDINFRIERYGKIINEIKSKQDVSVMYEIKTIELAAEEKQNFVDALDGEIYKMTARRRNYILLRLNSFVSEGVTTDINNNSLTIEHVLPQTINLDSDWAKIWIDTDLPEEQRYDLHKKWLNRIANLVPLTQKKNSEAQNYDFEKKKKLYFMGKNGTSSYPLTTQVLNEESWTPEILIRRQVTLLAVFKYQWDL